MKIYKDTNRNALKQIYANLLKKIKISVKYHTFTMHSVAWIKTIMQLC